MPSQPTPKSLTISVRGVHHKATGLTLMNYLSLASLIKEKGTTNIPDLTQSGVKESVAESMWEKLSDPDYIYRLSYSLLAIFPTLSTGNLVWFSPKTEVVGAPWGTSLELQEVLDIMVAVAKALSVDEGSLAGQGFEIKQLTAAEVRQKEKSQRIMEMEAAIAALKNE